MAKSKNKPQVKSSEPFGILTDFQIREYLEKGLLLQDGTFDYAKAKYCTYELRVSREYEILNFTINGVEYNGTVLNDDGTIEILPGSTLKINAIEKFNLPANIYGKVTTVGQIFSSGLAAENTYVDPGYVGPLYITLHNITNRVLTINVGSPLARVEFHKLNSDVEKPHPGYQGRRASFINSLDNNGIRNVLVGKSIDELVTEMVQTSLDEAIHQKFARAEVIIEKLHEQDIKLNRAFSFLTLLSAFLVFIVTFLILSILDIDVMSLFDKESRFYNILIRAIAAFIAAIAFFFFSRKYLRNN